MQLTEQLVPAYINMLTALSGWLDKAASENDNPDDILLARLAPDMFPLTTQIRFACVQAYEVVARLKGEPFADVWHDLIEEGRNGGDAPGTVEDAQARIRETLDFLDGLPGDALDGGEGLAIAHELPTGMIFDMTGEQYARDGALPQFYFHLMTAYAILRHSGVNLGKADYVQHAFAYLRPGTMPEA
ncbi:MAG: DUF1993 domain-containing protein [Pseudomonadota bacterium]